MNKKNKRMGKKKVKMKNFIFMNFFFLVNILDEITESVLKGKYLSKRNINTSENSEISIL